jgi:hypothetical protein
VSRLFVSTPQDPRRLNQPWHERIPQTHGERHRIHGPIQPMARTGPDWDLLISATGWLAAAFTLAYFAAQLLRRAL